MPKGSGVEDHREKNLSNLSYRPPGCFALTLMKKLFNKASKMSFKYSGGRVHCERRPNFP